MMNREALLRKVQMLGFVVVDTILFLNTHPNDEKALSFFEKYRALYEQAKEEYESEYGPLTAESTDITDGWSWIDKPWPWEMEG